MGGGLTRVQAATVDKALRGVPAEGVDRHAVDAGHRCSYAADAPLGWFSVGRIRSGYPAALVVLDTVIAVSERHHGVGIKLATQAERGAHSRMRLAARRLRRAPQPFYFGAYGFNPTHANLINLRG